MWPEGLSETSVFKGTVALAWVNRYSGIFVRTSSNTILFDPVDVRVNDVKEADAIVVTHEHPDHFDPELVSALYRSIGATIITSPFVADEIRNVPSHKVRALRAGESIVVGASELYAERSDHPRNQPLTFVVTTKDGVAIYHSSDSRPFSNMSRIGEKYRPAIALCTVGIGPGASPSSGAQTAKLVRPKVAIPYHTDQKRALSEFVEILKREEPTVKTKVLERFEVYRYPER